jgi:hypothetical protein
VKTHITLAASVSAYLGYYMLPMAQRPWGYYVASGVLVFVLAAQLRSLQTKAVGVFAYTYVMIESAQQAVCGAFAWGAKTGGMDVCKVAGLGDMYPALAALGLAALWAWRAELWPNQQRPK